jgi:hypothetical protein
MLSPSPRHAVGCAGSDALAHATAGMMLSVTFTCSITELPNTMSPTSIVHLVLVRFFCPNGPFGLRARSAHGQRPGDARASRFELRVSSRSQRPSAAACHVLASSSLGRTRATRPAGGPCAATRSCHCRWQLHPWALLQPSEMWAWEARLTGRARGPGLGRPPPGGEPLSCDKMPAGGPGPAAAPHIARRLLGTSMILATRKTRLAMRTRAGTRIPRVHTCQAAKPLHAEHPVCPVSTAPGRVDTGGYSAQF